MTREEARLKEAEERTAHWKRWGPYLAERQWGTVREDYSPYGTAWDSFPHDHARSRAYRWGEDGPGGITDNHGRLCFALALWNGRDPVLKERLFGLTGSEGNHGEDVKEYYFYLDSTPTHSYMKFLYKYPQAEFPYSRLVEENRRRDRRAPEFELMDTGVFEGDRYFDVLVEYAKAAPDDLLIRITATNRGPEAAELHLLPTVWFRNTWSWDASATRPVLRAGRAVADHALIETEHEALGPRWLYCEGAPELLFTENETNGERLWGEANPSPYVKDGINACVVDGEKDAVNPAAVGTKAAARYRMTLAAGQSVAVRLRLANTPIPGRTFGRDFDVVFAQRLGEADEFYATVIPKQLSDDAKSVIRHAFAALRVYRIERRLRGRGDRAFLERVFHKLLLNFTWWVNRKDAEGKNVFQGGFLGLDNIGVFDRSAPLPTGGHIEQSDGTSWMAMYCLNMLAMALELAYEDPAYEDVASKFWEHFTQIAFAMNNRGEDGVSLWNDEDGFFYDVLHVPNMGEFAMKTRSMVGLIPLYAVDTLEPELLRRLPAFKRRMDWFVANRPGYTERQACMFTPGMGERRLISILDGAQ